IKSDVFKYLEKAPVTADLVFADPPYDLEEDQFNKIVLLVMERNILNPKGILIIEHSKHTKLSSLENYSESRKYGNSVFSFFVPKP
ncbi:MAG: RsmD family RNA methyltransferase, partial [Gillisia sp.]